jgi:hypothetical protein
MDLWTSGSDGVQCTQYFILFVVMDLTVSPSTFSVPFLYAQPRGQLTRGQLTQKRATLSFIFHKTVASRIQSCLCRCFPFIDVNLLGSYSNCQLSICVLSDGSYCRPEFLVGGVNKLLYRAYTKEWCGIKSECEIKAPFFCVCPVYAPKLYSAVF